MEIFNFYRKFESNLKNGLSGNSVNISKINRNRTTPPCSPPSCRRRLIFTACSRGDTPMSPWRTRSCAVDAERLLSRYKEEHPLVAVPSFHPLFRHHRRRRAPPLAAASAVRPLPKLATPQVPFFPCAPIGASRSTSSHWSRPCHVVFLAHGQRAAEIGRAMARALRSVSPSTW